MSTAQKIQGKYTYADYAQWPDDQRCELIDGEVYAMTAPSRRHQTIVFELGRQIGNYLQGKACQGYTAPFDVRLPNANETDDKIDTVIQPDLSVICDATKLDNAGCRGAPDWIIEVISLSTALLDMNTKRRLYEQHGVLEYWIVHPEEKWIMVYTLDSQGHYGKPEIYGMHETTLVHTFPDLSIDWTFISASTPST